MPRRALSAAMMAFAAARIWPVERKFSSRRMSTASGKSRLKRRMKATSAPRQPFMWNGKCQAAARVLAGCSLPQARGRRTPRASERAGTVVFAAGRRQSSAGSNPRSGLLNLCRGLAVKSGDIPQCGKQPVKLDRITVDGGPFIRAERYFLESRVREDRAASAAPFADDFGRLKSQPTQAIRWGQVVQNGFVQYESPRS